MHTEVDYILPAIYAMQAVTQLKREQSANILGLNKNFTPSIKNRQLIDMLSSKEFRGFDLDARDLTPMSSSPSEPSIKRIIRNLNSNNALEDMGLVVKGSYAETGGYILTPLGGSITPEELIELIMIHKHKHVHQEKKKGKLRGLHNPVVPSIKIKEKVPTTKSHYCDSKTVRVDAFDRSDGFCETCGSVLPPNESGGKIYQLHHMFDEDSKNDKILSKIRYDHPGHVLCCCGRCHDILHQSPNKTELNFNANAKIRIVNILLDEGADLTEIHAAQQKKIISF